MNLKIIIGGVAVLAAAGGVGYGVMYGPWSARGGQGKKSEPTVAARDLAYVDVKEMTLRLADTAAEHYIRMTPVIAVPPKQQEKVEQRVPVVRDRIVTIVSGETSLVLATPEGERQLKKDILAALHKDFGDQVIDLYFSGYLVE
jgi:flagellar basal body-associated protein FliL